MFKIKLALVLILSLLFRLTAKAQEKIPMVRGNVDISVSEGTIACDLILSNLPEIKNYVLRLNSGMNIHYFKDLNLKSGPLYYDMDTKDSIGSDETKAYYLHENTGNPERYIPQELEVKYLGMYPVVRDSSSGYMGQDWRGNIAFNGYSVRAEGIQGDWYPVLYDKDKRKQYNEVKYNIKITCSDCNVLFVNGSAPVRAGQATFVSDTPYEMSIFCGSFKAIEKNGVWLLNSGMTAQDEQKLFGLASSYEAYYANAFDIPFRGKLTYVQADPVADPTNWAFAFYAAPTTFNVGVGQYGLSSLFEKGNTARNKQIMAHELAHYYFGTLLKPGGLFGHVISEGFAEYLSYKLTRSLEGEESYKLLLKNKISRLNGLHHYRPLSGLASEKDYGNREYYLYYYTPVLLLAVESEIGAPAMWKWLRLMVAIKPGQTDYAFLLSSFKSTITDKELQAKVVTRYFESDNALQNAKDQLQVK